jgi:hypothetical protein
MVYHVGGFVREEVRFRRVALDSRSRGSCECGAVIWNGVRKTDEAW